jgi:hypothetical protein
MAGVAMSFALSFSSIAAAPTEVNTPAPSAGLTTAARVADHFTFCGQRDPFRLGYDHFYTQHCEAQGLDVMASSDVNPVAVERAAEIAIGMIGHRQDLIDAMISQDVRIGVIGRNEVTTDMPEYRDIYEILPYEDWNTRVRGLGATPTMPLSSVGEENIMCDSIDNYLGSSIMVHEFAHTMLTMGLRVIDPAYNDQSKTDPVFAAWVNATETGRWANTYAITNADEYWAETVMSYFDTNIDGPVGGDGLHNQIDTRVELAAYDPQIYAIIDDLFRDAAPLELCNG